MHESIVDICISMMSKDYLDVPERINNIINVNLSEGSTKKYKQLESDLVLELGGNSNAFSASSFSRTWFKPSIWWKYYCLVWT